MYKRNFKEFCEISKKIEETLMTLPHTKVEINRGDTIFFQGEKIEKFGFILEGAMKCSDYSYDGDEIVTHYFYEGEIFPEYQYFTGQTEYLFDLLCEKKGKLLLVDNRYVLDLVKNNLEWNHLLIEYMAWRGIVAERWMLCNGYRSLRSRIIFMLLEIFNVSEDEWTLLEESQKVLAMKLNVSRPMYNQELVKIERENLIERDGNNIRLLNEEILRTYI